MTFLTQLYSPVRGLSRLVNRLHAASAAAERIIEMLDQEPSVAESSLAVKLGRAQGKLQLEHVGAFGYLEPSEVRSLTSSWQWNPAGTGLVVGGRGARASSNRREAARSPSPTRTPAGSCWTDGTFAASPSRRCETTSRCCCRRRSSSTGRSTRTSLTAVAKRPARRLRPPRSRPTGHEFISALADGYETEIGQKGREALGRAATADRDRAGDGPGCPGADPRRADHRC